MSIYDVVNSIPAASLAQNQWQTNTALTRLIGENLSALIGIYDKGFKLINANPYGLTVQQVVMGVGASDWQKFYTEAVFLRTLINHVVPGTISDYIGLVAVVLSASPETPASTDTVTLTCALTPVGSSVPTGFVSFYDGDTLLENVFVNGSTVSMTQTFSTGTHALTAVYSGDLNFCPVTAALTLVVS